MEGKRPRQDGWRRERERHRAALRRRHHQLEPQLRTVKRLIHALKVMVRARGDLGQELDQHDGVRAAGHPLLERGREISGGCKW